MLVVSRAAGLALLAIAYCGVTTAATPKEIEASIKKGAEFLKSRYGKDSSAQPGGGAAYGIGPTCLAGLALLEAGVPPNDPALKNIIERVRNASYNGDRAPNGGGVDTVKTYQTSLSLLFLDRLGEPADVPLIQVLAVRLLAGQGPSGGWTYETCGAVSQADEQRLRGLKADQQPGKMHPEVEKYAQALFSARGQSGPGAGGDNSNTQFAVIAVWLARKHGVPVDSALELVEKRFLGAQNPRTGGWSYTGGGVESPLTSPSMHCAGLIGLATGVARREERRLKAEQPKKESEPKKEEGGGASKKNSGDPFFNPPAKASGNDSKKPAAPKHHDARDRAVELAFSGLGVILADSVRAGRGSLFLGSQGNGNHDLYFFWSLERASVIYGVDKIGGIDWYEAGSQTLVRAQNQDGSWPGSYGTEVDTSFAVLFLCKSNLARDLSSKVQKDISTEMRAGTGPGGSKPHPTVPGTAAGPEAVVPDPVIAGPTGSQAGTLAGELLRSTDQDWAAVLKKLRNGKGTVYTQALVASVNRLDGERRHEAREALAERLTRMTAETLRTMAKVEDIELRRAALLAMAMKDDKSHIPDLITGLVDSEEVVVRAAKAGLKSLAGQDFGPAVNATAGEKKLAATAWKEWLEKQKK